MTGAAMAPGRGDAAAGEQEKRIMRETTEKAT